MNNLDKELPETLTYPPPPPPWPPEGKEISEIELSEIPLTNLSSHIASHAQDFFENLCIPFFYDKKRMILAVALTDPTNEEVLEKIKESFCSIGRKSAYLPFKVYKITATKDEILKILHAVYPHWGLKQIGPR